MPVKITVLFGSFNPMTNAHLSAMRQAIAYLDADKGLFVATNDQYLLRKAVKLDDPLRLTEAERAEIIKTACLDDDKLEFWGFELGGINPKRYQTLCKIQEQYPDAELYEIQGADKVRSAGKVARAEDYLSNIRFAVFQRSDVDLDNLIATTPILNRHKSSFILLPALEGESAISSTEVRRRFYASEDYRDIIPKASANILAGHSPHDFSIPYELKMQTIMRSGRFGVNHACRQVYSENTALFNNWKNGAADIDLGDYHTFLDNTTLYKHPYTVRDGAIYSKTETGCINMDCMDLAEALISDGYNPAILNLASAHRPCGGYDKGMHAQEESLCQSSNLSLSLYQFADPTRLKCVHDSGVKLKQIGYPLDTNFGGIYTPRVTFFRNGRSRFFTLKDKPFRCDVITVAALSFNGRSDFSRDIELQYRSQTGGFTPEGEEIMLNKIRTILRMGIEHGKDSLILGAFGCGAYRLPSKEVARLFKTVLSEPEFLNKFRLIVFAILESTRKPHGPDGRFAAFYSEFGTFSLR